MRTVTLVLLAAAAGSAAAQPAGVRVNLEAAKPFVYPFQALDLKVTVHNDGAAPFGPVERAALAGPRTILAARPAMPGEERRGEWTVPVDEAPAGPIGPILPGESFTLRTRVRIPESVTKDMGLAHVQWVGLGGAVEGMRSNELQVSLRTGTNPIATLRTSDGEILIELLPDKAPKTVANFMELAGKGFYDGLVFHRVDPRFVIQTGCPEATGKGGPGYTIEAELNDVEFKKGTVGLARNVDDPDSGGSQFFVCVADAPQLNNQFTAFGRVIHGQEIADAIGRKPRRPGTERPQEDVKLLKLAVEAPEAFEPAGFEKRNR